MNGFLEIFFSYDNYENQQQQKRFLIKEFLALSYFFAAMKRWLSIENDFIRTSFYNFNILDLKKQKLSA